MGALTLRVVNRLRDIADATVRDVIRFVCPSGVSGFDVRVGKCLGATCSGRAYVEGASQWRADKSRGNVPYVVVHVGPVLMFPHLGATSRDRRKRSGRGYLGRPHLASQLEALVYIMAHELRHLWQRRVPKGRRVWGSRGQYSERDADAYAIRMLRRWRREAPTVRALGWYLPEPKQPRRRRRATTTT